jgi:hypothetical protein
VAAADHQVLQPPDDLQAAVPVEPAEVAAHEPAATVERLLGGALVVEIAQHQAGAAAADLADGAGGDFAVRVLAVEDAHLVAAPGAAAGVDDGFLVVAGQGVLVRGVLGHAVDVLRHDALVEETLRHRRRDRRAGHVEELHRAEAVEPARPLVGLDVHGMGRHAHDIGGAALEDPVERLHAGGRVVHHQLRARYQRLRHRDPGDVV